MPITIGNNIASLNAQRRLTDVTSGLRNSFERLSSGLRINHASDDAAGLAVSSLIKNDTRVFTQAVRNVNDGLSVLNIAEGALKELSNITIRQRELAEQAANGVYSVDQRRALNKEANALVNEFNRVVATTDFNGLHLIDKSIDVLRIQAGYGANGGISLSIGDQLARTVGDGTFKSATSFSLGDHANDFTSADFNGDGKIDLASIFVGDHALNLMYGNGDGTFTAATSFAGITVSAGFSVTDINRDGYLDLLASSDTASEIYVILGCGNGGFRAPTTISTYQGSGEILVADFNNDGRDDIVAAELGKFEVLLGNGNGTFRTGTTYQTSNAPLNMGYEDFNNDGVRDLFSANVFTSGFHLAFGNSNGTFRADVSFPGAGAGFALSTHADVNADGFEDAIVSEPTGGAMAVRLGNGNGTFAAPVSYGGAADLFQPVLVDVDGDGKLDLVSASFTGGDSYVYLGNGNGTFKAPTSYNTNGSTQGITLADVNGDGVADLVAADYDNFSMQVLLGNSTKKTTTQLLNISSVSSARNAMSVLDDTLRRISSELGAIGATQSRLSVAVSNLTVSNENFSEAASRITDVDVAQESADLTRKSILQQAAAAVLGQANQQPGLALLLLGR